MLYKVDALQAFIFIIITYIIITYIPISCATIAFINASAFSLAIHL